MKCSTKVLFTGPFSRTRFIAVIGSIMLINDLEKNTEFSWWIFSDTDLQHNTNTRKTAFSVQMLKHSGIYIKLISGDVHFLQLYN